MKWTLIMALFFLVSCGGLRSIRQEPLLPAYLQNRGLMNATPDAYQFFVAGHVYGNPARKAPGLHPSFVADFPELRQTPDLRFGVFTGDIVYYSRDTFWDKVDEELNDLEIPVLFAAGNHDEGHRSPYRDRYGQTYYSIEYAGDLLIVLNPGLGGWNIWNEQLAFLQRSLQSANKYRRIFVFSHQVLWWEKDGPFAHVKPNSTDSRAPDINFWPVVMPLLQATDRPVFCFAGDVGANRQTLALSVEKTDNVTLIASGMGNGYYDNYLLVQCDSIGNVQLWVKWLTAGRWERLSLDEPVLKSF